MLLQTLGRRRLSQLMINHYDIAYGLGVGVSAPYWLVKPSARRKVFSAFRKRMGRMERRAARDPASGR